MGAKEFGRTQGLARTEWARARPQKVFSPSKTTLSVERRRPRLQALAITPPSATRGDETAAFATDLGKFPRA
ncbi:MAG: hypothetical protein ACPIA5_03155, partial [Flavobacteriales bacterium]